MTEQVKDLESQETDEQENQVPEGEDNSQTKGEAPEGAEAEGSEAEVSEDGESESGGDGEQEAGKPEKNRRSAQHRVSNRIRKLKGDLNQSETGNADLQNQLAIAKQRIEIMRLANNQKGTDKKPVEPSPDDFEDGVQDPKYVKKFQEYLRGQNKEEIKQEFASQAKTFQENNATDNLQRDTERKQREHYRRAIKGNSDYEEKEDTLTEILGTEAIKDIINNFDDSDNIIYQLGADEDMAYKVLDAMDSKNHVLAVRLLERASNGLKPKLKNNKPTPDPDKALPGGSPGAVSGFEAKRLKILKKATDMNDQSVYSDFMDEHRKEEQTEMAKHSVW